MKSGRFDMARIIVSPFSAWSTGVRRLEHRWFRLRPTARADRAASAARAGSGPHADARSVLRQPRLF